MRKLFVIIFLFGISSLYAQTFKLYQTENIHNQLKLNTKTGEIEQIQSDGQKFLVSSPATYLGDTEGRYELYKTENIWTFILLDRFEGRLWQCQFSIEGDSYRFAIPINSFDVSNNEKDRFTIQPMTSIFQFYLINERTGDMWKFQWSTEGDEYRWIERV